MPVTEMPAIGGHGDVDELICSSSENQTFSHEKEKMISKEKHSKLRNLFRCLFCLSVRNRKKCPRK